MATPFEEPATAVAEEADIIRANNTEDAPSRPVLAGTACNNPKENDPVAVSQGSHAVPFLETIIQVKLTAFTNPLYAYEATIRTDVPGGVQCVSKFGATPEEAVERLSKCAGDMLANGARILWSDGTESLIGDDAVIFDIINDRRLLNEYFNQIHNAVAPPPLLDSEEATALVEALFRDVSVLVNDCAAKVAARQA